MDKTQTDTKDGIRELIELRNKRNSLNSGKSFPVTRPNENLGDSSHPNAISQTSMNIKESIKSNFSDPKDVDKSKSQGLGCPGNVSELREDYLINVDLDTSPDQDPNEDPIRNADPKESILEYRRSLRKNMSSVKSNYWSTMRALSNDDSKRFGPFSTGSNSASPVQDDLRENNSSSEIKVAEENDDVERWHVDNNLTKKVTTTGEATNGFDRHNTQLKLGSGKSLLESTQNNNQPGIGGKSYNDNQKPLLKADSDENVHEEETNLSDEEDISMQDDCSIADDPLDFGLRPQENVNSLDNSAKPSRENSDYPDCTTYLAHKADASKSDSCGIWTLPADRNVCTLEEIRRGQVINSVAFNECPVMGCGKKINEMRAEPSPGTIASGLRTHVLFVHYANRKISKKRKLCWTTKKRNQPSPKKSVGQSSSQSSSSTSNLLGASEQSTSCTTGHDSSLNLLQRNLSSSQNKLASLLDKKVKQTPTNKAQPARKRNLPTLAELMLADGPIRTGPLPKQKNQDTNIHKKNNFNPTTSSLFSILAGLTQQQQQVNPSQPPMPRNLKSVSGTNTINISQCSKNSINTANMPVNSSLLSLLNEKISGNVANSLQSQLKKSLSSENRSKVQSPSRQNINSGTSLLPSMTIGNETNFNNSTSILNSLCSGTSDSRPLHDNNTISLNSFIESIASKTGSNLGPAGVAETKRIIEKFTSSLICSSQTIADHYLAPFAGDVPQQKPEISPSDLLLAYKMMHKSLGQP